MDGLLLIDKPGGVTSHDVVARARRAVGQREVGHAGTLDPMATGLLVVLLGEGTKLSAYLTADDKRYLATVRFGASTDTLDADGAVTATSDAPPPGADAVAAALARMRGPMRQVPPAVSAIKQGGVALHERVRRGEAVVVEARDVVLHDARLLAHRPGEADLEIHCSKGFYVRSLARDLAAELGTLGHLSALRRTQSGPFRVEEALAGATLVAAAQGDAGAREVVQRAVLPLGLGAPRAMRAVTVDADTARALGQGKRVATAEAGEGVVIVLSPDRALPVCVGEVREGVLSVVRGFRGDR